MGRNESTVGNLNKGEKPKMSIKNNQQKPLLLDKHRHFKVQTCIFFQLLSFFFLSKNCQSPSFAYSSTPFYTPLCLSSWNLLSSYSPSSDTFLILCKMNMDFWGLKHFSGKLFSNKCNCTKQVDQINVELTVTLSRNHPLDH